MANTQLAFKVRLVSAMSNFTNLAKAFEMASDAGLKSASEYVREVMVDSYNLNARSDHPLTAVKKSSVGYDRIDIPGLIGIDVDSDGDLRVGFFDIPQDIMNIIFLHEYGGLLTVTDRMRAWYNAMAYRSMGWKPKGPWAGYTFSKSFKPLKASTRYFKMRAKLFMRHAFKELGNENKLMNQMKFVLENAIRHGKTDPGTFNTAFDISRK